MNMTLKHTLTESIIDAYTLLPPEIDFIKRKNDYNRLAQALLLKYGYPSSLSTYINARNLRDEADNLKQKRN
jgi:hypothetical protein